jgi:hypothetical protein
MRKTAMVAALLLAMTMPASAQLPKLGVGAFGGLSFPVAQADQKQGTEFGLRARLSLLSFLSGEAQLAFTKWGKPDPVSGSPLGISGSKVTAFGVNGLLGGGAGVGIKPFFVVGLGTYKIKNDDTHYEVSRIGYSGGLGLGIGVIPKFGLDIRGELVVIPLDGGGSKKAVKATVGVMVSL